MGRLRKIDRERETGGREGIVRKKVEKKMDSL